MTFGSMRRLGVRSLAVTYRCHHETIINADRWLGQMRRALVRAANGMFEVRDSWR